MCLLFIMKNRRRGENVYKLYYNNIVLDRKVPTCFVFQMCTKHTSISVTNRFYS